MRVESVCPKGRVEIALLGEAPGVHEESEGIPFVGPSGQELTRMLSESGINRDDCWIGNLMGVRPPANDFSFFTCSRKDLPSSYALPAIDTHRYLKPEYTFELERLRRELEAARPNVIVAFGNKALWALCGFFGISSVRGYILQSSQIPSFKVIPTIHPAAVMREWTDRVLVKADLLRAKEESAFAGIRRPQREIWLWPNLQDLRTFERQFIEPSLELSIDIETRRYSQISCIGFSPNPKSAIVVPFLDERKPGWHYWETLEEELEAWRWVRTQCARPGVKVGQNHLYDIQFLWDTYRIPLRGATADTMLLHHAMQPEMPKSLEFLGSIYTKDFPWKRLRRRSDANKREE